MENFFQLRLQLAQREKENAVLRSKLKHLEETALTHKTALRRMTKQEQRLQILHEHSQEIIFICDINLICRYASPSITQWLEFLPREIVGKSIADIIQPESRNHFEKVYVEAQATSPEDTLSVNEFQLIHKNKSYSYFEINVTNFLADPALGGLLVSCRDISIRKRAQEQQQFLIGFGEKLLSVLSEEKIIDIATTEVGHYLKASTCFFAETVLKEDANIHPLKVYPAYNSEAGPQFEVSENDRQIEIVGLLLQSLPEKTLKIEDTRTHPLTAPFYESAFKPLQVQAVLFLTFLEGNFSLIIQAGEKSPDWKDDTIALLHAVLERTWLEIYNARLFKRAQTVAVLEERNRIARELHDSLQQDFYGIILATHSALKLMPENVSPKGIEQMQETLLMAEGGMTGLRSLIFELKPDAVRNEGLVAGLMTYVNTLRKRYRLTVESSLGEEPSINLDVKDALYRAGREALFNAVKHANATVISISLDWNTQKSYIELVINDNGVGFDVDSNFNGHFGLASMNEIVTNLGGTFVISSTIGKGTRLQFKFPVQEQEVE